jgi:hypothetical protein
MRNAGYIQYPSNNRTYVVGCFQRMVLPQAETPTAGAPTA